MRPGEPGRWSPLRAVLYGAALGLMAGLVQVAATWHRDGDHTFQAVGMPFGAAIYGAAIFLAIAKLRNLLVR